MNDTIENKSKFFAQYWGQNIVRGHLMHYTATNMTVSPSTVVNCHDKYLSLVSLKNLSKQDIIEISKISTKNEDNVTPLRIYEDHGNWAVDLAKDDDLFIMTLFIDPEDASIWLISNISDEFLVLDNTLELQQYLISKGYALPYLGMSVLDLERVGFIKIR